MTKHQIPYLELVKTLNIELVLWLNGELVLWLNDLDIWWNDLDIWLNDLDITLIQFVHLLRERWLSGNTLASHHWDPGSIPRPARCLVQFVSEMHNLYCHMGAVLFQFVSERHILDWHLGLVLRIRMWVFISSSPVLPNWFIKAWGCVLCLLGMQLKDPLYPFEKSSPWSGGYGFPFRV